LIKQEKLGPLVCYLDKKIGKGSFGQVFRGVYEAKEVAIKRILIVDMDEGKKDIKTLIKTWNHPNILNYVGTEKNTVFRL